MALEEGMIVPFEEKQIRTGVISYGLSSYGYDIRVSNEFKVFQMDSDVVLDPKAMRPEHFLDHVGQTCIIPPHGFVLARTVERFKIPRKILTLCVGKSTYARCGVLVNVTPFEPGWEGYATLEFKVNLVRGVTLKSGTLRATGKVVHAGKSTATAEARLEDASGALYAHASATCIILGG